MTDPKHTPTHAYKYKSTHSHTMGKVIKYFDFNPCYCTVFKHLQMQIGIATREQQGYSQGDPG